MIVYYSDDIGPESFVTTIEFVLYLGVLVKHKYLINKRESESPCHLQHINIVISVSIYAH